MSNAATFFLSFNCLFSYCEGASFGYWKTFWMSAPYMSVNDFKLQSVPKLENKGFL